MTPGSRSGALYRLLKPVNKDHAVLMVVLALLGIPIAFLNEVNHLAALRLLSGADDGAFTSTQLHAQAMLFLDMRRSGIFVAQVFWGLWLVPLGFLVFRSGFLPKLLGTLLVIGGAGYLIDSGTQLLSPGVATIGQFTKASATGEIPAQGPRGGARWTARYFVRRVAWHVMARAWEFERPAALNPR